MKDLVFSCGFTSKPLNFAKCKLLPIQSFSSTLILLYPWLISWRTCFTNSLDSCLLNHETFYSVLHFKGMQIGWNIVGDFPQNWIRAGLATPRKVSDLFVFYLLTCPVNMDYQGTCKYFFPILLFWPIVDSIRVCKTAGLAEFLLGNRFLMKRLPFHARMLHVRECYEGISDSRLIFVNKDLFLDFT